MTKCGTRARRVALLISLSVGLSPALLLAAPMPSGTGDTQSLSLRLAADEAAVQALQSRLASDQSRAGVMQVADLFGPSDEERAAAAQHEQAQDSSLTTLDQRASGLEDSLRRLTGQVEVLEHRLDEFDTRLERMQKDFNYKLCTLSAQQLGAGATDNSGIPCPGGQSGAVAPAAPAPDTSSAAPAAVTHLAPGPGVLGTLPQGADNNPPPPSTAPAVAPSSNQVASIDTHAQFEAAMNLLAREQYDDASAAFRNFADTYPKDSQAPQALYWLGDIAYVQKDYDAASHAFAEVLTKYPASSPAPESMLKLGQSLLAMNEKQRGCTALHVLETKYHSASKTVLSEAEAVRKAGGCH